MSIVTRQSPLGLVQAPLQPLKLELLPSGIRVTPLPLAKCELQPLLLPVMQAIPGRSLVTVPEPVPSWVTVSRIEAVGIPEGAAL